MNKENLANAFVDGSLSDSATSVDLKAGYVTYQPTTPYFATITPFGELSTKANSEIVEVTNKSGDTLTIVRGQRGTTAKSFSDGAIFSNGIYVEDLDDLAMTILKSTYPIGSSYWNGSDSRNPSVIFGFGTWTALSGLVLGGRATSGSFNVGAGTIIGADTHQLTTGQLPQHGFSQTIHGQENGTDIFTMTVEGGTLLGSSIGRYSNHNSQGTGASSRTNPGVRWGSNQAHNNIQRTKVGYLWERTA